MENVPQEANNNNLIERVSVDKKIDAKMDNETSLLDQNNQKQQRRDQEIKEKKVLPKDVQERQMDGGIRAWLIVLSSFLCNGLIFGVINSFSLVYGELQKILEAHGVPEPSSKAG